jgi:pSer/pThr/pTyr-binding forkhead associated (FHA) protein/small basic protein
MALILEIRDARGIATLHRLDMLPVTIGRALSNDIILDDPYIDARHASIGVDESGVVTIGDLGSLNGLRRNGTREDGSVAVKPGTEVRIGRTTLRFRDVDEVVAPALADEEQRATAPATPIFVTLPPRSRLLGTTSGRLGIAATTLAAFALSAWLGSTERSNGTPVLSATVAIATATLVWATLWTLAGRGPDRRSNFLGHFAIASLALLAMLLWGVVNDWLSFLFPDAPIVPTLFFAVFLAVLTALVAGHLGVSGTVSRRARWRGGLIASAVVVAMAFFVGLVNDDKFSDVPKFASEVKPLPTQFIPTKTVAEFDEDVKDLKGDVDEALEKQASRAEPR